MSTEIDYLKYKYMPKTSWWFIQHWAMLLILCLLDAFIQLRKVTISFVMSACPSVRIEQLGSHWTDFHEIW